jgi:hypothetical protein
MPFEAGMVCQYFVDDQIAREVHASHSYLELLGIFQVWGD